MIEHAGESALLENMRARRSDLVRHTRPILEAFFHARFFLEMAVRYADLPGPPTSLPSGWAALLYLYELR